MATSLSESLTSDEVRPLMAKLSETVIVLYVHGIQRFAHCDPWFTYCLGAWLRGNSVKGRFSSAPFCGWDR